MVFSYKSVCTSSPYLVLAGYNTLTSSVPFS
nr:MAG TPA: hypothetical protein [Caudoviricetes sp.]